MSIAITPVVADAAIPALMFLGPLVPLLLVPVVALETVVAVRSGRLPFARALGAVAEANVVSALIGVPLVWVAAVAPVYLGLVPAFGVRLSARRAFWWWMDVPWLAPRWGTFHAIDVAAGLVLFLCAFFVSVWIEGRLVRSWWDDRAPRERRRIVWRMNLLSYTMLLALWLFFVLARAPL